MEKIKSLAPDGSYDNGDHSINGYSQTGQELKERFLREARALLKQAGQFLAQAGWTKCDVRVNPAGMAVSGDTYADFWNPADPLNTVYCTIGASAVSFGGRKDGVIIMARKEKRAPRNNSARPSSKPTYRNTWMGMNQWIDPGMNARELAAQIFKIAGQPEQADHIRMLAGCTYHSRTAGFLAIPSAIVRNDTEAAVLKEAFGNLIDAARTDASVHNGEQPLTEAKTGLRQLSLFEVSQLLDV
jgi:hypothetical protein